MTNRKQPSKLEFIGLLTVPVVLIVIGLAATNQGHRGEQVTQGWLLGQIAALEQELSTLVVKASHYLENAPRDYDTYFRDSIITHAHLRADMAVLENRVASFAASAEEDTSGLLMITDVLAQSPIEPHSIQVQDAWQAFSTKLDEQLGVDPEMPRLEWGARHITEESGLLLASVAKFKEALQDSLAAHNSTSEATPFWIWPALIAWMLLSLVWLTWRLP